MQKDVIYIDVEDDITSIISKVKAAESGIVALVPPKRIGAIQSAVNLKLVHRAAERAEKRLVIITNNPALSALAGSAGIPVAKNLQSRPEMAEIPALEVDSSDNVIDGALEADAAPAAKKEPSSEGKSDDVSSTEEDSGGKSTKKSDKKSKNAPKIPNFNSLRKKILIGVIALIVLIGGGIWAFVIAPRATITVSAQTSNVAVNTQVSASDNAKTSLQDGTLKLTTKTKEQSVSKTFTATGKKDVGEKAKGTVRFTPTSTRIYDNGATIPAGTTITSSDGNTYVTDSTVLFDNDASASSLSRGKTVSVTATASGSKYNGASGRASGPSGFSTNFTGSTSGGTDKTVTVVQQSDINNAINSLLTDSYRNEGKSLLQTEFGSDFIVVDESFTADESGIVKPAVDSEAPDGQATISGTVKFTLSAVSRTDVDEFLKAYCKQQIDGKSNQRVYNSGAKDAELSNISISDGTVRANLTANGKVGPEIDEEAVKEYVKGKNLGEVQERVKTIDGVNSVDVKFSPFWVHSVPGDVKKIEIKFEIDD